MSPSTVKKQELIVLLQDFKEALSQTTNLISGKPAEEISATSALVGISSTEYTKVAPGVWDKVLPRLCDLTKEDRRVFYQTIRNFDFESFHIILVKFEKGGILDAHLHPELEIINVVDGSYLDSHNKETFTPGETQVIPPQKAHSFVPLSNGHAVVRLQKT